jgi:hypothetical protein
MTVLPKSEYKVAIIVCWNGSWPWHFPFFLHTCSYNRTIDFIICTDKNPPNETYIPPNVKFIPLSLSDLNKLFSKKLGFGVNIEYPYKLCDFKPAYGFLFDEQ